MTEYSTYQKIYKCSKGHLQGGHNDGICRMCGEEDIKETVGRWVDTTTFLQQLTATSSGHWEEK